MHVALHYWTVLNYLPTPCLPTLPVPCWGPSHPYSPPSPQPSYHGIRVPSPAHYLQPHLLTSFISFLMKREVDKPQLLHHLTTALRVVSWLRVSQPTLPKHSKLLDWLKTFSSQIARNMRPNPTKGLEALQDEGKFMPAEQLLPLVLAVRERALALADIALGPAATGPRRVAAAKAIHDACLVCMLFGFLPPLRPSCVVSTLRPGCSPQLCLHPDCQHPTLCAGNRLVWRQQYGSSEPMLVAVFSHHKNEGKWAKAGPIECPIPYEVTQLVKHHLQWGHTTLTAMLPDGADEPTYKLFVDTNTGR